jgi:hypothetical protein
MRARAGLGIDLSVPPIKTVFPPIPPGSDPYGIQATAQQQLLTNEQTAQSQMQQALGQLAAPNLYVLQPGDLEAAKASYDKYAAKGVQGFVNIATAAASGQPGSFTMMTPLIGAMLTAAAVAPVVGAVVAGGLAILDQVAEALNTAMNGSCNDPKTQWQLPGGMCITRGGGRPVGPTLPLYPPPGGGVNPDWRTWDQFIGDCCSGDWKPVPWGNPNAHYNIDGAFPMYAETIGWEMDQLLASPPGAVRDFWLTYYRAWQHAAEQAINGFVMPTPWAIFSETLVHWNATHPGPSVTLIGTSFPGDVGIGMPFSHGAPNDPNGASYIGALLNGDIANSGIKSNVPPAKQNPQLNTGGIDLNLQNIITLAPGSATATTMSVPAKVALVTAGAAGAGALTIAVVAWAKHETFGHVLGRTWDWVKHASSRSPKRKRREARTRR